MARASQTLDSHWALTQLRAWYQSPLGQALALAEQAVLEEQLPTLFGYHLLTVDPPYPQEALRSSRISHQAALSRLACDGASLCDLGGDGEALPVRSDSVDAILLPHSLEVTQDPHQVLREVDRCLVPEGHVVILGFNPLGWWGAWGLAVRRRRPIPWRLRFIAMNRVKDWLSLLGFDTLYTAHLFHRPPLQSVSSLQRLAFLDNLGRLQTLLLAGGYCLVARKRVATLTPIRPRWRPRRGLLGAGVIEPSNRSFRHRG